MSIESIKEEYSKLNKAETIIVDCICYNKQTDQYRVLEKNSTRVFVIPNENPKLIKMLALKYAYNFDEDLFKAIRFFDKHEYYIEVFNNYGGIKLEGITLETRYFQDKLYKAWFVFNTDEIDQGLQKVSGYIKALKPISEKQARANGLTVPNFKAPVYDMDAYLRRLFQDPANIVVNG